MNLASHAQMGHPTLKKEYQKQKEDEAHERKEAAASERLAETERHNRILRDELRKKNAEEKARKDEEEKKIRARDEYIDPYMEYEMRMRREAAKMERRMREARYGYSL